MRQLGPRVKILVRCAKYAVTEAVLCKIVCISRPELDSELLTRTARRRSPFHRIGAFFIRLAPFSGVDSPVGCASIGTVDGRKGWQHKSSQSKVGWVIGPGGAICWAPGPEKTDDACEGALGSGTAKAVITSGVVTVHASTLSALSQELAARA